LEIKELIMKFFDLGVESEDAVKKAKDLGFSGVCLIQELGDKRIKADADFGVLIKPKKAHDVSKYAKKLRERVEVIFVEGSSGEINRAALECREVDVLRQPWGSGDGEGINHILARLGRKNNVSIEFNFRQILHSNGKSRGELLSKYMQTAKLVKKYKTPFIITSGALSPWDLRSPSDLISFGKTIGFHEGQIKKALSGSILKENKKRLSDKWIMPGVEIV
jgi:ribonuclease P/MRP protein subunit RPP1